VSAAAANILWILLASALTAVTGCSNSSLPGASAGPSPAAEPSCEQVLKIEDVAGLLNAPITATRRVSGDAQSCEYLTAGFAAVMVSVRPGLGQSTVEAWAGGKMPLKVRPLDGIGDAAVWQETLHELISQKNRLLCDIQVRGYADDIAPGMQTLPDTLGALCNKIFAAH